MYIYLNSIDYSFRIDEMKKPSNEQLYIFEKAKRYVNWDNSVDIFLFIYPLKDWHVCFNGIACKLSNFDVSHKGTNQYRLDYHTPYGIVIYEQVFEEFYDYQWYVLTHELKHCQPPEGNIFRAHDHALWDIGWEAKGLPNIQIGFFHEEWDMIKCSDDIMYMFSNVDGIDEYI
jgi:hypothetical protein